MLAPPAADGLRFGDVVLEPAAATPSRSAAWRLLQTVCGIEDSAITPLRRQTVVDLDSAVTETLLVDGLRPIVRELAALDAHEARRALLARGFECPSLYWGAWSPSFDGIHHVLWRPDRGTVGATPETIPLPLYPAVRLHAAVGEPVVHAAAVAGRERAVLFLGRSGAGKTTAARNAHLAGAQLLGDDAAVLVRQSEGSWLVVPLPGAAGIRPGAVALPRAGVTVTPAPPPGLPGTTPARPPVALFAQRAPAPRVPLAGLCFLEAAPEDRLTPMDRLEAARRLTHSCFSEVACSAWLPRPERVRSFGALTDVARTVPSYTLALRDRPDFYALVCERLALDG